MSYSEKTICRLCANGRGFYCHDESHGLCTGCYYDYLMEKISVMMVEVSMIEPLPEFDEANRCRLFPMSSDKATSMVQDSECHTSQLSRLSTASSTSKGTTKPRSRCGFCEKRVGLLGFPCQHCEGVFCGSHRHTEDHACSVDLKRIGRRALAEQNPIVKSDKLRFRA